jgi:hypothetical protein
MMMIREAGPSDGDTLVEIWLRFVRAPISSTGVKAG